jgi:hypothetical protein
MDILKAPLPSKELPTSIRYPVNSLHGISLLDKDKVVVADREKPIVVIDTAKKEILDEWPFHITDINYLAEAADQPDSFCLGSMIDEMVLMQLPEKRELAWIPGHYNILIKHPTRPLWAAVQKNILSFFTYETESVSQGS